MPKSMYKSGNKPNKPFKTCSRCPNPRACSAANGGKGMCLAKRMGG